MDKERASSEIAWLLSPGEEAILAANVQVSLKPFTSFGVSGKVCLTQEKEKCRYNDYKVVLKIYAYFVVFK